MNAVILMAVLSVGNSAVGSLRTLAALTNLRQAPKILSYIGRKGRPLVAIVVASAFDLIGFFVDFI
jgi:amino acid transporter